MATVTGLTAERMQEIIDATIVDADVVGDNLILTKFDTTTINAGNVRGPQGVQGPAADIGDVKSSIKSSITGWWHLDGSTKTGAQTSHPALWAEAPASWKSGANLILPDLTDAVVQGGGTVGAVTGANTKTIVEANLPPHVHTGPSHTHTGPNHTHSTPDHNHPIAQHQHSINHDHADATTSTDGSHTHDPGGGAANTHYMLFTAAGSYSRAAGTGMTVFTTTATDGAHDHTVNIPAFAGNTGTGGPTVTGLDGASTTGPGGTGVTSSSGTGNTGPGLGTSTPLNVEQKALRLNWFIYHGVA